MSKKNKNVKNKKAKRIFSLIIILALISCGVYFYLTNRPSSKEPVKAKSKVVDSIKEYGYTISDTSTKLFKNKFNELKRELNKKEIDNKKYSELVAELFVIDFYTLDNKVSKNDIGGVQFVYTNYKATFIDKARDEFYKYVKNNLNDDRNQELPEVSTIKVESSEEVSTSEYFDSDELKNIESAYKINLSWTYKKDLGYETSSTLIVVKDGKKYSVAKLIGDEE